MQFFQNISPTLEMTLQLLGYFFHEIKDVGFLSLSMIKALMSLECMFAASTAEQHPGEGEADVQPRV